MIQTCPASHESGTRPRLNLAAIPKKGLGVFNLELDLTTKCNLNCRYCYKDRGDDEMPDRVAFDAMIWLLHASGGHPSLVLHFMGGEPLLRFHLVRKLVPFALRRAKQFGKKLTIGMTTNGTLLNDDMLSFCKTWNVGFHTSIDGIPEVQDHNRPTLSGAPSSPFLEKNIPNILEYRPYTTARSTVVAENVPHHHESYLYFRSLGYIHFAQVPGNVREWDEDTIRRYEDELRLVAQDVIRLFRAGTFVAYKEFHEYCKSNKNKQRRREACGAGLNMAAIDMYGNIWPCPRWTNGTMPEWKMGNIYEGYDEEVRTTFLNGIAPEQVMDECGDCVARSRCGCGCMVENLLHHGGLHCVHPNYCKIMRAQSRVAKELHDTLHGEKCPTFMNHYYRSEVATEKNCLDCR